MAVTKICNLFSNLLPFGFSGVSPRMGFSPHERNRHSLLLLGETEHTHVVHGKE